MFPYPADKAGIDRCSALAEALHPPPTGGTPLCGMCPSLGMMNMFLLSLPREATLFPVNCVLYRARCGTLPQGEPSVEQSLKESCVPAEGMHRGCFMHGDSAEAVHVSGLACIWSLGCMWNNCELERNTTYLCSLPDA